MIKPRQHPEQTAEERAEEVAWVREIMGGPTRAQDVAHEVHRRPEAEDSPSDAKRQ